MAPPLPLMFLLMIPGVCSQSVWSVNYSPSYICALKGSSVIINCTYKYPPGHQIMKVFWTKSNSEDPPDLSEDSEYSQRIQYLGDKQHDCSIRLTDVRHTDSHMYYFRFITNKGKWIGAPGVTVDVTDLQVESAETVTEGHSVTLTCKSRCSLTDRATFIWIKNTQSLRERTDRKNQLILQSVRREDAGSYSCAVQGHSLTSPAVYLNVMYAPDNPVISTKPSVKIVEGDSVTLTCISEANPPAEISWFKETHYIGSGSSYNISKISSDHSEEYKCKSSNEHGEKYSDTVTLNVFYPPKNVSASISGSGEIVEGDSVTLTCSSEANPPAEISWFKETHYIGSGSTYNISKISSDHSKEYKCKSSNEHGEKYSAVTLNVLYPPKKVSASISGSGKIVEGDSVTLTCSSESNPPVQIYTWFKENETSAVGSGQTYSITNINSSHSGWFYCKAQNEVGSQRSAAVSVTVLHSSDYHLLIGISVACGGLFIIVIILFVMRKRRVAKIDDAAVKQDDLYCHVQGSESAHCDDVQYDSGDQTSAEAAPESRDPEEIQYASVHHHLRSREMRRSEEIENHYDNIRNDRPDAAVRSHVEETSVIYSSVK